jgi:hypothetical protein
LLDSQVGEISLDFSASHFQRMALVVIEDESLDPGNVSFFGAEGAVSPVA